jgi:Heparinase II/III N-terminus/Heparinase II/III-like protein
MMNFTPQKIYNSGVFILTSIMAFSHFIKKIRNTSYNEIIFRISRKIRQVYDCYFKSRSKILPSLRDIIRINDFRNNITPTAYRKYWNEKKTFYFSHDDHPAFFKYLLKTYPQKIDFLLHKADAISNLEIPFFNKKYIYYDAIDWNKDPKSGKIWPLHHWSKIKVVDTDLEADPKFVWELNRHQYLIYTAMSFWLSKQEKYAEFTLKQIIDWIEQNPIDHGINWVESLEVGTRLISWVWIMELLRDAKYLTSERLVLVVLSMHAHAEHLYHYKSHYISPNTHLTGESLALFIFSAVYPEDVQAQKWEDEAKHVLDKEIMFQVGEDGVHKELSTAYHTYTLDYYFQYIILCYQQNKVISRPLLERIEKMCEFVLLLERPDGTVPLIGDSDGGASILLDPDQSFSWKQILCNGALLFNRSDLKYQSPVLCWHSLWLWGKSALHKFSEVPLQKPHIEHAYFKDSNYIVYRSDWTDKADYLLFDAGKMGFLSAGHSHADYMSFELTFSGNSYISDVGTFSYHKINWRQYCRGTQAHNTVTIDNRDQATPMGSFSWQAIPEKGNGRLENCQEFTLIIGTHNAYPDINHSRTFIIVKNQFVLCFDHFNATGRHRYDFNYHFSPGITASLEKETIFASKKDGAGMLMVPFLFQSSEISIHKGCSDSYRGFSFPTYGEKNPIYTARISEDNEENFIRGMLFAPYRGKLPDVLFTKIESADGFHYSYHTNHCRYLVYTQLVARTIDTEHKILIDCEYLIESYHNSHEVTFFAVGVSSLLCNSIQLAVRKNKLAYILLKQKHEYIEIYFAESDQVEIPQPFNKIIFHGIATSINKNCI